MNEFFRQLQVFSDRLVLNELQLSSGATSPWGGASFIPKGAVIHYTADEDLYRVLRWFLREKYEARVSAHAVVADRRLDVHDRYAEGLPLVQALPATVVQTMPPDGQAWHATWANKTYYGIENVCAGELRRLDDGAFVTWRPRDRSAPKWTTPWEPETDKTPLHLDGRWWSPYTRVQVEANVILLRELRSVFDLRRAHILGHEQVQGVRTRGAGGRDKRDPGPAYPLWPVREAAFSSDPLDGRYMSWLDTFRDEPERLLRTLRMGALVSAGGGARFLQQVEKSDRRNVVPATIYAAMRLLGYRDSTSESFEIFCRMVGLHASATTAQRKWELLVERLRDRGILDALE